MFIVSRQIISYVLRLSTILGLLAHETRRRVLLALCDAATLQVPEALHVRGEVQTEQSREDPLPKSDPEDEGYSVPFEIGLYHIHLPKLADRGIIEWDRLSQTVSRGPNFEAVEPVVRLLAANAHILPGGFSSRPRERTVSPDVLKTNYVFSVLAHPRRRYLCYLLREDSGWTLTDLATELAAWENDIPVNSVTDKQRTRVYTSLYHVHVPKLVEEGVATFDDKTEMVSPTEYTARVLTALQGLAASLDVWEAADARKEWDDEE